MEIVLITGMSGSGKSVALNALEDAGYYCVDNLPPELLEPFVALEQRQRARHVAIAMDVRSATSLPQLPALLNTLREQGHTIKSLFLDAATDTLVRRYSETRRKHPLSSAPGAIARSGTQTANANDKKAAPSIGKDESAVGEAADPNRALIEAIELERELLADLRDQAQVIDTSVLRAAQLQSYIKEAIRLPGNSLTLVFESFAFKRGIPVDADYVFDVRMLPNPHYEPALKDLTGRDQPVIDYLRAQPEVDQMRQHIERFLNQWLAALLHNHRSYVTVAIGCTGGQHRSVYLVEELAQRFATRWTTLKRHRELG
ncbi:nucleotide-binding protein [Hylemonella gracilis str. Niagara R]|uniref:Nucleotide-binding protein n=1 Tax=Hylemonella gracilis str. Niagara R TaxID=1458275 RepID=A0A016XMW3_9BURK|nr:RNase adapter RapZ [Hylemonella gracilis]EYC52523.1 nucleotide-binding protein [Hylemonella gracilis str. Niagara R]